MSGARGRKIADGIILVVAMALSLSVSAQTARTDSLREMLIGAFLARVPGI
jgi:hypothetical protein